MDIMTLAQQELVSQNLNVVDIIIRKYITVRPDIPGMEYDDLYQIGSLHYARRPPGSTAVASFPPLPPKLSSTI